jgi:outer membrane receptor protein involved in Fe transport
MHLVISGYSAAGMKSVLFMVMALTTAIPAAAQVRGSVIDGSGAPIAAAVVRIEPAQRPPIETSTGLDGRFEIAGLDTGSGRLVVSAPGFATLVRTVDSGATDLLLTLEPAPVFEVVNITSSRGEMPRADPTVTVSVLTSADLASRAAVMLDDALKLVPGFTLFRRTSSRVSNPTAQGITLRGLGGTGSSRSLVLADGLPLNDAFGGWVYWDKIPQAAVERVEVLRGSGSDLYGADAVGGVVQIVTQHPGRTSVDALAEGGTLGTGRLSLFAGGRPHGWSYTAAGEWFTTAGYILVAPDQRGPIDTKANSDHRSLHASIGRQSANGWRVEGGANVFAEDRDNGTPAVWNATAARQAWGDVAGGLAGGLFSGRVYGGTQGYDQTFSAVSADRTSEDLNRRQHIPTRVIGVGGQWIRQYGAHALLVGAEGRFIKGRTQEERIVQGVVLATTDDGGVQQVGSLFVQDTITVTDRLTVVGGAHGDGWHSEANNTDYDKTLGSLSPRASAAYRISNVVSVRGSAYGGFRAPTLNELYRGFRTGNTQTNPNEALKPERLHGADGGVLLARGAFSARATAFWNILDDVITNVTLLRTPALVILQRQNADKVRSTGVEIEAALRIHRSLAVAFSGAVVDARFKGETTVKDNRVPQVPRSNLGVDVQYNRSGWSAGGQLRITGEQFEDDLNTLLLRRATVVDVIGSRVFSPAVQGFVALENVFDEIYDVGRTPTLTVGLPRTFRGGLRLSWR